MTYYTFFVATLLLFIRALLLVNPCELIFLVPMSNDKALMVRRDYRGEGFKRSLRSKIGRGEASSKRNVELVEGERTHRKVS